MAISVRRIIALAVFMSACWLVHAGTASGVLKVNGKAYQIKEVYLLAFEDPAKNVEETILLLSDRPIPEKLLSAKPDFFDLRDAGMNGLDMRFSSNGENYSMQLIGAGVEGSFSSSGTFDRDRLTSYQADRVAGNISAQKSIGELNYEYEIAFDATPVTRVEAPPPSPAEIEAARNSEPAKSYMAYTQALRQGDLPKIAASVVPERAAQVKDPQFKQMLEMIQLLMPSDIAVIKATIKGANAELELTGKDDGKQKSGIASLRKIGGKWLIDEESWK
ncbi:MAG: hypothetical protein LC114_25255 [Bryobacterales bacterium]|nr:hypothetical protein [Bryobacterales bacterium]